MKKKPNARDHAASNRKPSADTAQPGARKWLQPDVLLIALLVLALLPFLALSFYNHPQNDDFVFAAQTKSMGFLNCTLRWYNIYSGRYFSLAASNLSPLVYNSLFGYKLLALSLILLLFAAIYVFLGGLSGPGTSRRLRVILALFLTLLYLFQMPNINESIYWFNGAISYQSGSIGTLFLLGLMMRQQPKKNIVSAALLFPAMAVLIIIAAGSNEVSMLLLCEVLALTFFINYLQRRAVNKLWLACFLVSLAAGAAVVFAPGTHARYSGAEHKLWFSAQSALVAGAQYLARWMVATPLAPLTILYLHYRAGRAKISLPFKLHPGWSLAIFFSTFFALFFPPFYSTGVIQERTVSVLYIYFLIGWFVNLQLIIDHFSLDANLTVRGISRPVVAAAWAFVLFLSIVPQSNVKTVYADLFSGTAHRYDREQLDRYAMIEACPWLICEVPPIKNRPASLFFFDDALDEKNDNDFFHQYKDNSFAAYFGKMRIRLPHAP